MDNDKGGSFLRHNVERVLVKFFGVSISLDGDLFADYSSFIQKYCSTCQSTCIKYSIEDFCA